MTESRRTILRTLLTAPAFSSVFLTPSFAMEDGKAPDEQWYWYPFHTLTVKATGNATGGTCSWMLVENSPRQGVPFHKHRYEDESFYVVDGTFEITVGDATVTGGPGTYVYGPRNVPHRWTNMGSARGRLLNVFAPSGIEEFFLAVGVPIRSSSERPKVDVAAFDAKASSIREKYGVIRTGPPKFPEAVTGL
jgi:quercetin dioxygenase-like cupin family protein